MNRYSGYFFSLSIIILRIAPAFSQANSGDTLTTAKGSEKVGFGIYVDYGKILTLPSDFEKKAEVGIGVTIGNRWTLLADLGYALLSPQNAIKNGSYESSGYYLRGGLGYQMEIVPNSFLVLGGMIGQSHFDDMGTVIVRSSAWPDFEQTFERSRIVASWLELLLITEQRLKSNLALGSRFRLRRLLNFDNNYEPEVYSIPGYGRTLDNTVPAVNLFVKYMF